MYTKQLGQKEVDELGEYTTFASGDKEGDYPPGNASTIIGSTYSYSAYL